MIKFFRQIRQQLINEGKTTKYFKYAVGEIILVVIGILIALQVNNWNEKRKLNKEGKEIRAALHLEFTNNRKVLSERIQNLEEANRYVELVLDLAGSDEEQLQAVNIDSIISLSLSYGNYNPPNSTIQELISSGKLNLIKDDHLKEDLFNWLQMLEDTDEDFKNQDLQAVTMLEAYLSRSISNKNMARYHPFKYSLEDSRLFQGKYEEVFSDVEFENLYYGKKFWNLVMIDHYKALDTLAMEVIAKTEP